MRQKKIPRMPTGLAKLLTDEEISRTDLSVSHSGVSSGLADSLVAVFSRQIGLRWRARG